MLEKLKKYWPGILGLLISIFVGVWGYTQHKNAKEARQKRIEAQNELAEKSEVIKELEGEVSTWSRLSKQRENIIAKLNKKNEDLASILKKRKEKISSLTETVAKLKSIKIDDDEAEQTEEEGEDGKKRIRVAFNKTKDPINVKGYTLTDPPEAHLEVSFIKPLKLRTTITQRKDGSWRTYVSSNYPNLEIENIDTTINPYVEERDKNLSFIKNIIVGMNASVSTKFDSLFVNLYGMYEIDNFALGPSFGVGLVDKNARFMIGLSANWKPWGN